MSRLDSAIRRLSAQRACLGMAARMIAEVSGPVLELGLGNGRTYDHLREVLPGREIYVFERRVAAHPASIPDDKHLILGDFQQTLPGAIDRIGAPAALVHADVGSGDSSATQALAAFLGLTLPALVAPGAVILSDQDLKPAGTTILPLPDGVESGRYFAYRKNP